MAKILVSNDVTNNLLQLEQDYDFTWNDTNFRIMKGFTWDGASIPRFFWRLVGGPFVPQYWRASLVHDFFCIRRFDFVPYDSAAEIFHKILLEDNVSSFKAGVMKSAVLLGGPKWGYEEV